MYDAHSITKEKFFGTLMEFKMRNFSTTKRKSKTCLKTSKVEEEPNGYENKEEFEVKLQKDWGKILEITNVCYP